MKALGNAHCRLPQHGIRHQQHLPGLRERLVDFGFTNLASGKTGTFAIVGSSLEFTVIPEPSALALGLAGISLLLRRRREAGKVSQLLENVRDRKSINEASSPKEGRA